MLRIVALELTNRCNLRCRQCPQAASTVERGDISRETLSKALQYCSGYTELNWRGEPLLNQDLVKHVAFVKAQRPDLYLGFHTNGTLLTQDVFRALCEAGLDWMQISLHSAKSCEVYLSAKAWNTEATSRIHLYADTDSTDEVLLALSCGLRREDFRNDQLANWAGFLTGGKTVAPDPLHVCQSCHFITQGLCIMAWDGTINACCWDFDCLHRLGTVDTFDTIAHTCPYPLCAQCIWIQNPATEEDKRNMSIDSRVKNVSTTVNVLETGYHGYNILSYLSLYWAAPQASGDLNFYLQADRETPGVLSSASLEELKSLIDSQHGASSEATNAPPGLLHRLWRAFIR